MTINGWKVISPVKFVNVINVLQVAIGTVGNWYSCPPVGLQFTLADVDTVNQHGLKEGEVVNRQVLYLFTISKAWSTNHWTNFLEECSQLLVSRTLSKQEITWQLAFKQILVAHSSYFREGSVLLHLPCYMRKDNSCMWLGLKVLPIQ